MGNRNKELAFDEKINKTLESNAETQKEIARALEVIEEAKKKTETVFREMGITPEMEAKKIAISDLSTAEQKLFEVIQRDFRAELAARGLDADLVKSEQTKSKANLTLSRKRLRI